MRKHDTNVRIDEQVLRHAKSIASLRGMSLKEYFGVKVAEDLKDVPREFLHCGNYTPPTGERRKKQ